MKVEHLPLLSDAEVQALRWAIARARTSPATPPDGEECNAAAAVVDRLAEANAVISPEVDRATAEAARELCATLSNHPAAMDHLRMYPDALPGPLHQIARWAREWKPTAPAPEPLPRTTEQELRAWAAAVDQEEGDHWRGVIRCAAAAEALEILDAGDEPDPADVAEAGIADLVYADVEIKRRLARLEARERDVTNLLDEKDERLDALEKRVAAILASMEDGARQHRAADLAHLQASLAVTEEVMRHGTRLDDHVNRFEVLETRLASYGKRLERVEQARAEQQAAAAAELDPEDVAEELLAYTDEEVKRRLDDHVDRFDRIEERLAKAETLLEGLRR